MDTEEERAFEKYRYWGPDPFRRPSHPDEMGDEAAEDDEKILRAKKEQKLKLQQAASEEGSAASSVKPPVNQPCHDALQ